MSKMSVLSAVVLAVALMAGALADHDECMTVMNIASEEDSQLSILAAAIEAVNVTAYFNDPTTEATVFAPTDAAFKKLLESMDLADTELLGDIDFLTRVLYTHIVPGPAVFYANMTDGMFFETEDVGSYLSVNLAGPYIMTEDAENNKGGNATVLGVDIQACSTVVHVIDSILVPVDLYTAAVLSDESA